ncbi:receptor-type tyrosine-protein phosphatase F-like [Penaeus indicus]|uniref:receptor-type tyrosine-protein phosphatase F-like n=1 Tax=Penaeus indicus TaxID=29960 RepID=UPI00300C56CC
MMRGATKILVFLGVCVLFSDAFGISITEVNKEHAKGGNAAEQMPQAEPGPPTNIKVNVLSSTALEVTWDPAPDSTPQYYRVLSQGSGITPGDQIVYDQYYLLNSLLGCTEYFITIISVYSDEVEYRSEPVDGTTDSEVPPMPANCTIVKEGPDSVSLSWVHPLTNCPVYNYNISWEWQALWNETLAGRDWSTSGEMSYTIIDIRPYSEVLISIQGKTSSGYGLPLECEAKTKEDYPSSPKIVSVTEGPDYLSVTWEPPEDLNGVIKQYRITRIGNAEELQEEADGDTLTKRLYGVEACQNYTLTVAAKTAKGFGEESNKWEIYVTGEAPLETVRCTGEASRNFTVIWDHGSVTCKDQNYYITWNSTVLWSDDKDQGEEEVPGNETTYAFLNTPPYTEYTVCVAITKGAEESVCCDHITAEDGPSQPTITEVSSFRGDVRISWSPPEEANGIVRSYNVSWESETADSGSQGFEDVSEGLVEGPETCNTYALSVSAGTTVWGNKSEAQEVDVVNYVDTMSCSSEGTGTVHALFKFASTHCEFNLRNTNWKVDVLWNNDTWTDSASDDSSPSSGSFTVGNLDPYTQVEVCMSVPARDEEKACCTATTDEAAPSKPSEVIASQVTNTTARISWTKPLDVNGAIKSWEVNLRKNSENDWTAHDVEGKLMYFDATDLTPSTNYEVLVKCQTGGGLGEGQHSSFKTLNPDNTPDSKPNLGLIIGLSAGAGALLLLVFVGVLLYQRKKRKTSGEHLEKEAPPHSYNNNGFIGKDVQREGDGYEEDYL